MKQVLYALIILTAVIPSMAFAHGGSQIALFTPWTFIESELKTFFSSQAVQNQQDLGDFDVFFDPLTWHLKGAKVQLQANYQSGPVTENSYELSADKMSIDFSLQQMSVDQIIQKEVNGVIVNVHVQATCGPITLHQPSAQVAGQLQFALSGQSVETNLSQFALSWSPGSWTVSDVQCTGPGGFDAELKQQLIAQLQTADGVKSFIGQVLAEKIQSEIDNLLLILIKPQAIPVPQSPKPLTIQLQELKAFPQGALAIGALVWSGSDNEQDLVPLPDSDLPAAVSQSTKPVVLTPTAGWSELIDAELSASPSELSFSLNQNQSFQRILDCWLLKLFLWPDLLHYTSASPFQIVVDTPKDLGLQWKNDGSASFQVATTGFVTSVREKKQWRYLLLNGSFQGTAVPSIQSGNLNLKIAVDHSSLGMKFDPGYIKAFSPNTHVGKTITKTVQSYLAKGISFQTRLPEFNFGSFGIAQFQGWQGVSTDLIMVPLELVHR